MNEEPLNPEEEIEGGGNEAPAPRSMIFTLLLLIAGFLFASALLLHHGMKAADPETRQQLDPSALIQQAKEYTASLQKPGPVEEEASGESGGPMPAAIGKLFTPDRDGTAKWPKMKLTGFGRSTEGNGGFAIINGRQILLGEQIDDDVTLVEIRTHDVVVERMGERKTLTVEVRN